MGVGSSTDIHEKSVSDDDRVSVFLGDFLWTS